MFEDIPITYYFSFIIKIFSQRLNHHLKLKKENHKVSSDETFVSSKVTLDEQGTLKELLNF